MKNAEETSHRASRSHRFAKNVGFSVLGQIGVAAAGFFCIPYLVHHLGNETYGIYILLNATAGYVGLLSLGVSISAVKYLAQFRAAKSRSGVDKVVRFSCWIYGAGGIAGGAVLAFWVRFWAVRLFHVPANLVSESVLVLRCAALGAAFGMLTTGALALMQGFQRFDWLNFFTFLQGGFMTVGAAVMVALGFGLSGAAFWYVGLSALLCFAALGVVFFLAEREKTEWQNGPTEELPFRRFAFYGVPLWAGGLATAVTYQFDRIFVARYVSLASLTLYSVPEGLLQRIQVLPWAVAGVLIPMMAEVTGPQAATTLARIYLKSVRVLLWAVLPAMVLFFSFMPQFLSLWLGGQFGENSVWPARLLVLAYTYFLFYIVPAAISAARDRPRLVSCVCWAQAALSLIGWKWAIPRYGIMGAAAASLVAQVIPNTWFFLKVQHDILKIPLKTFWKESLFGPVLSAAILLGVVFPFHSWASNWMRLMALGGLGALAYYASVWAVMGREDRDFIKKFLRLGQAGS